MRVIDKYELMDIKLEHMYSHCCGRPQTSELPASSLPLPFQACSWVPTRCSSCGGWTSLKEPPSKCCGRCLSSLCVLPPPPCSDLQASCCRRRMTRSLQWLGASLQRGVAQLPRRARALECQPQCWRFRSLP